MLLTEEIKIFLKNTNGQFSNSCLRLVLELNNETFLQVTGANACGFHLENDCLEYTLNLLFCSI